MRESSSTAIVVADIRRPPRMPLWQFIKTVPSLLADRAEGLRAIARAYGDLVRVPVPGKPFYLATAPEMARHVLQSNTANYRKSFDFRIVRDFLGEGLVTSHDDVWKSARKKATPAFRAQFMSRVERCIARVAEQELERWQAADTWLALERFSSVSMKVFCLAMLGIRIGDEETATISRAVEVALRHLDKRLASLVDVHKYLPTPSRLRFSRARNTLDRIIASWVADRRAGDQPGDDLLSVLIGASRQMPDADRFLRDQLVTYLVAGHETVAVAMSWCAYLLASHPDAQDRARRDPAYAEMVVRETMRLYPPVWSLGREAIESDRLGDCEIEAGATVMVSPYVIHRSPKLWDRPDEFLPERFESDPHKGKSFVYFPFSSGPRFCIGERVAMLEMKLLVSMMLERYSFHVVGEREPGVDALISLRPDPDIELELRPL